MAEPRVIAWAGGEHAFALDLGLLRALQDRCDAGPEQVFLRLGDFSWRVDDVTETIRLGLMGGGMSRDDAARLMDRVTATVPLMRLKLVALSVLAHALAGPEDDRPGERQGGVAEAPPESGSSRPSTETVQ